MHLVIVSPFPPSITGIGQYGYHITRALAQSGAFSRITVLAGSHINGEKPNHLGSTEIEYCWEPGQLKARQAIRSSVKRLNPDLVWFNLGTSIFGKSPWTNIFGLFAPMEIRKLGIPTVVTLHELIELSDLQTLNAPGGPFAPLGARLLTKIVTNADVICLTMQHYVEFLKSRNINCIHIPIGAYHEPELLPESDLQELLLFTTIAPFKGLPILLEAFENLRHEFPNLKLTIAGAEHMRFPGYGEDLKNQFQKIGNIHWLGQVPEEKVMDLFQRAQLVILPYTAATGSSSVLYQAATWGRATIASDIDENKKLAKENNLQIEFFENGNSKSLESSIRKLLTNPDLRVSFTKHNLNSIQKIAPSITCHKYIEAFNNALQVHNKPSLVNIQLEEKITV